MPTIPVNNDGDFLYYEDSGAPQGLTHYTTIILLHGFVCHSGEYSLMRTHFLETYCTFY